jgi:hypothetical protein
MKIEILDKSKVVEAEKSLEEKIGKNVISEEKEEKVCGIGNKIVDKDVLVCVVKKRMDILSADKILECERVKSGTPSNCALCQGADNKIFVKCKNKWANY